MAGGHKKIYIPGNHGGLGWVPVHVDHRELGTKVVEDLGVQAADIRNNNCNA